MDYWAETMQDDCYLIAADGWKAETYRIIEKDKKGKEKDKGWTCDLVPKALIVARYFAKEQDAIDKLAAELESVTAQLAELEEEHGGEEGAFSELDKVNKANVTARLEGDQGRQGGQGRGRRAQRLAEAQQRRGRPQEDASRTPRPTSMPRPTPNTPSSPRPRFKTLVVDDKWLAALDAAIHGEMDRISQALTQRVKELAERYETPMPQQVNAVAELEAKVNQHRELSATLHEIHSSSC